MYRLVDTFHNGIGLWIASGDQFLGQPTLVFEGLTALCSELLASVHDDFCRPGRAREPVKFEVVSREVGALIGDFLSLDQSW